MSGSPSSDELRRANGSSRSLSQRVRSTSSPEALERTRRKAAARTRKPAATIGHDDILNRYRSGDTVGKRMGSIQGTNGHASKLPMLSDQRTTARTPASDSSSSNAKRIAAMRRQTAARSDAARTKAGREKAAKTASNDARTKAGREKVAKTASNDARIKDARSKYNQRIKDARLGSAKGGGVNGGVGNGVGGVTPFGITPNAVTTGNTGGVWNNGHNNYYADPYGYYNSCYWNTWGPCYSWGWGGWFCSPFYCTGYWWHSYWNWGGSWGYPYYYYGPFIPASYSVVYYEEPEVIYIDAPEEEILDEEIIPAETSYGSEQPDPSLQRELNRAAAYYLTQGDRAFRETRYGDAAHFYAKAVEFAPESGILYLVLSDALFATGDYRYAAYALRQALSREPSLARNVINKRDFYADPSDFDRQLATLERFVEDHVLDTDARLVLAANYLFSERPDAAIVVFDNPFSEELRGTDEGQVLLEAALAVENGEPAQLEGSQEF